MNNNALAHSFGLRVAFSVEMPLIAARAGYQAILLNMEHMAIGMETMRDIAVSSLNVGYLASSVLTSGTWLMWQLQHHTDGCRANMRARMDLEMSGCWGAGDHRTACEQHRASAHVR